MALDSFFLFRYVIEKLVEERKKGVLDLIKISPHLQSKQGSLSDEATEVVFFNRRFACFKICL